MRSRWGILTEKWEFLREFLSFPQFSLTNQITRANYYIARISGNYFYINFQHLAAIQIEPHLTSLVRLILISPHHHNIFLFSAPKLHLIGPHWFSLPGLLLFCAPHLLLIGPHWLVWVRLVPISPHRQTEISVFGPHLLLIGPHWLVWVRLVPISPHHRNEVPVFGTHLLLIG